MESPRRVMPTTIAAATSVSRPYGATRRCDMRLGGVLLVNIRVRIIIGSVSHALCPPPCGRLIPAFHFLTFVLAASSLSAMRRPM